MLQKAPTYGVMAAFAEPKSLLAAARRAREAGFTKMDAYTPFPVEGLSEEVGFHHTALPLLVLLGGIAGAIGGFGMQYFAAVIHYPLNIGGRPLNSWPAFIPITFELTILGASLFAVFGLLALNGLPTPYHPLFNVDRFELASREALFLCIKSKDPKFDRAATREFLESLGPREIFEVGW